MNVAHKAPHRDQKPTSFLTAHIDFLWEERRRRHVGLGPSSSASAKGLSIDSPRGRPFPYTSSCRSNLAEANGAATPFTSCAAGFLGHFSVCAVESLAPSPFDEQSVHGVSDDFLSQAGSVFCQVSPHRDHVTSFLRVR